MITGHSSRIVRAKPFTHRVNGRCASECDDGFGVPDLAIHGPQIRFGKRYPMDFDHLGALVSHRGRLELGGIKQVQNLRKHSGR
jgi:hypothetical protein